LASTNLKTENKKEVIMAESVYRFVEMVGSSTKSWEDAAKNAIETATKTLRETRVAEIKEFDIRLENGKVALYRCVVRLSFKYEPPKKR
jgi:dodecin